MCLFRSIAKLPFFSEFANSTLLLFYFNHKFFADPSDFLLTVLCKPNTNYQLPKVDDLPECKAWCPGEKPMPPNKTGLVLSEDHDNTDEYWEDSALIYVCQDPIWGVGKYVETEK